MLRVRWCIVPVSIPSIRHLGEFDDALVDCEECGKQFRADHLVEGGEEMSRKDLAKAIVMFLPKLCPLSEMSAFNLMFSTSVGAGKGSPGYLRPETAQSIFYISCY